MGKTSLDVVASSIPILGQLHATAGDDRREQVQAQINAHNDYYNEQENSHNQRLTAQSLKSHTRQPSAPLAVLGGAPSTIPQEQAELDLKLQKQGMKFHQLNNMRKANKAQEITKKAQKAYEND